jgi:hypothetical protein
VVCVVRGCGCLFRSEFTNDARSATGAKLYLQLKSGDSYLRERKSDSAEIFTIKDERHARYWMAQAFPALLEVLAAKERKEHKEARCLCDLCVLLWLLGGQWVHRASGMPRATSAGWKCATG